MLLASYLIVLYMRVLSNSMTIPCISHVWQVGTTFRMYVRALNPPLLHAPARYGIHVRTQKKASFLFCPLYMILRACVTVGIRLTSIQIHGGVIASSYC